MTILTRRRALAGLSTLAIAAATLVGATSTPAVGNLPARWVGTWGTATTLASLGNTGGSLTGFNNQSIRQIVRTSVGGEKVRIRLTNAYGNQLLTIGHATVGKPVSPGSADLVPGSIREITFGGSESATVLKGADLVSDPVDLAVPALSELAVTIYLPVATGPTSWHWTSRQSTFIYAGDKAEDATGAGQTATLQHFFFLAGVEVASPTALGTVVVLGDSISDGSGATVNANKRWPDLLAGRIVNTWPALGDPGVLNESLAGNRVTRDGAELPFPALGTSTLARLDTDAFGQPGVRTVIVQVGINDIQLSSEPTANIIAGLRQLAIQIKGHGVRALVSTLGPFEGYPSWNTDREASRLAVNEYLRTTDDFDGLIDLDKIIRDPAAPSKVLPAFDSGDHIHPNDAGAAAIANAVSLWLL
ncbi:lysophospholipase L1-like esterase [Allocatelliglobosispora scoriae]|uniref:Lysophospholipase L1-like esterase n=1 Tax=Allocatelliglobosispora scoriae TaxID=643052 RepID=A0A841BWP2_9ACTN|nr:GDSL-type esterase/lipase family protein [Allocatelliglobosispora scoriae]MBB5872574.1 lysophospholipase L1-like esterase [Allocatelliglobosispora scoriae]